jgi:hypothetical protein
VPEYICFRTATSSASINRSQYLTNAERSTAATTDTPWLASDFTNNGTHTLRGNTSFSSYYITGNENIQKREKCLEQLHFMGLAHQDEQMFTAVGAAKYWRR